MKLYAIRDEKMKGYYSAPFECSDDQAAVVSLRDAILQPGGELLRLKAPDSVLVHLAVFDRATGSIEPKQYDVMHLSDLPLCEEVD